MEEKGIRTILPTSSHMLCQAIGINDASIRLQSRSSRFVRNASRRREPTADRMRPTTVLDCPMKAFAKRFSGESVVGLIFRSDTTSRKTPAPAFSEPRS